MNTRRTLIATSAAAALFAATTATALADDFELAMVIKSTTNPYYNATLAGAQIAAEEIGGKARNYGPTQSSAQAQVDIINNLADRHVSAIAVAPSDPDAVVPAMKRAAEARRQGLTFDADSAGGRPFFVNQATSDSIGRFGAMLLGETWAATPRARSPSSRRSRRPPTRIAWIAAFNGRDAEISGIEVVDDCLRLRQRAEGIRRDGRADHEISRSRRHLRADLPRPAGCRAGA